MRAAHRREDIGTVNGRFEIALFGQMRLSLDGVPLKFRALPKCVDMLAHLLLERGNPMSRETLAFTHWPDDPEPVAIGKMRRHLHDLHRALPAAIDGCEWLLADRETVAWNVDAAFGLDVERFEQLGAVDATRDEALRLYRGDLLEHIYDDWVFPARERLRSLYLRHLASMVRSYGMRRDFDAAIGYAQTLLLHEPWREDMVREVVALRYQAGDRAGALHAYDTFVKRLRDEMGVAVMPETIALRDIVIANGRLSSANVRPGTVGSSEANATRPTTLPLAGRKTEINQLRSAWQRAARGIGSAIFLCGEAGIGKSRLVDELAAFARMQGGRVLLGFGERPERAAYAPIVDALENGAAYLKADTLARLRAGTAAQSLPERGRLFERFAAALREVASNRPVVLVLEDMHRAGAATVDSIEYLVRSLGHVPVLVLVTFREDELAPEHPLRATRRRLLEGGHAAQIALDRLDCSAVAEIVRVVFGAPADGDARSAELFAQTAGHPLYLAELLRDPQAIGSTPIPGGDLASLVAERRAQLDENASTLAEIAAVAGDTFDLDLLSEVSGWRTNQVLGGTRQMLDRHLIAESNGSGSLAYGFTHNFIRDVIYGGVPEQRRLQRHGVIAHILARRSDADARPAVVAFHYERADLPDDAAHWYVLAARAARAVYALDDALRFCENGMRLATQTPVQVELLFVLEDIYGLRGEREQQRTTIAAIDERAAPGDRDSRLELMARRIRLYRLLGERQRESDELHAFTEMTVSGAEHWQARALLEAGLAAQIRGANASAGVALRAAAASYEALAYVPGRVEALCALADVCTLEGNLIEAAAALDEAQRFVDPSADSQIVATALRTTVSTLMWRQEFRAARDLAERILDVSRTMGDCAGEAAAHERLASIAARAFNWAAADEHFAQALRLYRDQRAPHGIAVVLLNFGLHLTRMHRFDAANTSLHEALSWFVQLQDARGEFIALLDCGMLEYFTENFALAKHTARAALRLADALGNRTYVGMALINLGAVERELGELDAAIEHMTAGLALHEEHPRPLDLIGDLTDLVVAYLHAGEDVLARASSERLLELIQQGEDGLPAPQYAYWAAAWAHHRADPKKARALLHQAHARYRDLLDRLPDEASRLTFSHLFFNRPLLRAWEHDQWPQPRVHVSQTQAVT